MLRILTSLLALVAIAVIAAPAQGQTLSAQDRADLQRIELYLNSITTLQARFVQVSATEGRATGTFYISRPGRMRVEYDPPVPYLYVADGYWLTFWDGRLQQRTDVPLGSTLADFLVRPDVRLSGDVTVTGLRRAPNQIEVDIVQTEDPAAGTLTLAFANNPLQLERWRVVDAQGLTTQVTLVERAFGVTLSSRLFSAPMPPEDRR